MNKQEKGLSLIESAMVLALASIVIAGVLYYYSSTRANLQIEQTSSLIVNVAAKVQSLYENQPRSAYAEIDSPQGYAIMKASFPALKFRNIVGRGGQSSWGLTSTSVPGVIKLFGGDSNEPGWGPYFLIQFWLMSSTSASLAHDLCVSLLGRDWGNSVYGVQVNPGPIILLNVGSRKKEIFKECQKPEIWGFTIFFK